MLHVNASLGAWSRPEENTAMACEQQSLKASSTMQTCRMTESRTKRTTRRPGVSGLGRVALVKIDGHCRGFR